MSRQIAVKPYRRTFLRPLKTARGEWAEREGFLLRLEEGDHIGYGEVAPLPEFGTESRSAAASFLEELVREPELNVPRSLPCCRFAVSAAAMEPGVPVRDYAVSALLPAGAAVHEAVVRKLAEGYKNLKWKIGVASIAKEIDHARRLFDSLPDGVQVRLDANGGLSSDQLELWIEALQPFSDRVDYLEQPLAVGQEAVMARYMADSGFEIALDESLNGEHGAEWLGPDAWQGPLIIKAPLMGPVSVLMERIGQVAEKVVFSSVFETSIGFGNTLALADRLQSVDRPIGFDTLDVFDDSLQPLKSSPNIRAEDRGRYTAEQIWDLI